MRTIGISALVVGASLLVAGAVYGEGQGAEEVVFESNFEDGTAGPWEIVSPQYVTITSEPREVISGKYSLKISAPHPLMVIRLRKDVDIKRIFPKKGRYYVLTFRYFVLDKKVDSFMNWRVVMEDGREFLAYGATRSAKPGDKGIAEGRCFIGPQDFPVTIDLWVLPMTVLLDDIRIKSIVPPKRPPTIPRLISPPEGMKVSSFSLGFKWTHHPYAVKYELQIARDITFREIIHTEFVVPQGGRVCIAYGWGGLDLEGEGRYFWRVRGINEWGQKGKWSKVRWFLIDDDFGIKELAHPPTPSRPLFLLSFNRNQQALKMCWKAIPSDLKPYCAMDIASRNFSYYLAGERILRDIPFVVVLHGPHFNPRLTLVEAEYLFQNFPTIKGVHLLENYGMLSQRRINEFRRCIPNVFRLAAKYGKLVVWSDAAGRGKNWWIDVGLDKRIFENLLKYKDYIAIADKGSVPDRSLLTHSCVLGYWLSGVVKYHGQHTESWFWRNIGYGTDSPGGVPPEEGGPPPAFFGQRLLTLGVSTGATVYFLGFGPYIWDRTCELALAWKKAVEPLLREVVQGQIIPTKEEVLSNIKVSCVAEGEDGTDWGRRLCGDFGRFAPLFAAIYGIKRHTRLLPEISRYQLLLPIVPPLARREASAIFPLIIRPNQFTSVEEARKFFDRIYPQNEDLQGDAWMRKVGGVFFVSSPFVDYAEGGRRRFRVKLNFRFTDAQGRQVTFDCLEGHVYPNQYLVVRRIKRGMHIHCNNRCEKETRFVLKVSHPPRVEVQPPSVILERRWDANTHQLTLTLSHQQGAVNIDLIVD